MSEKFVDIIAAISSSKNVIITGHIMPDGDSIGSTLALGLALEKLGKKVTMACPDAVPESFLFLPGADRIHCGVPKNDEYDTIFVVDCSTPDRVGEEMQELLNGNITVVNIDHHINGVQFADVSYVDSSAAATGEIIFDLLDELGVIDVDIAINLYAAILTDTGSFRYEATTSLTHRRVAKLLEFGINVSRVTKHLFDEKPLEVFMVLKQALKNLYISKCGRAAWISINWDELQKIGAKDEHTRGLVNYPRSIKGVKIALMFREPSPGLVKVSIRSNDDIDVSKIAAEFGGGGHKRAAGCLIEGDIKTIKEKVIEKVLKVLD